MQNKPELLLIISDTQPKHKDAFIKSLLYDLHISVVSNTIIALHSSPHAPILDGLWPDVTVLAHKYLEQRSLDFDLDRTIYQDFQSYSPEEQKPICGHIFHIFGKPKIASEKIGDKLYVGMPLAEIVQLLGEPSGINPGMEIIESGPHGKVIASDETRARLARTQYCMWKRLEGRYLLVIENDKLARIYEKP